MNTLKKYRVPVCRIGYGHATIEVTALNAKEAEAKAIEEAGKASQRITPSIPARMALSNSSNLLMPPKEAPNVQRPSDSPIRK